MLSVDGAVHLSASDLVGHLNCHYLTKLDLAVARGELDKPSRWDPVLEVLVERGALHEQSYLDHLELSGLSITRVDSRILVNAAIKKALCCEAGANRAWLSKVRPWYGHAEHFHVQIACRAGSGECKPQPPPLPSDGCGHELDFWFKESTLHPPPPKPKPPLTLAGLPSECKQIVRAP